MLDFDFKKMHMKEEKENDLMENNKRLLKLKVLLH